MLHFGGIAGGELTARRGACARHIASRYPAVGTAMLLPLRTCSLMRSHRVFIRAVITELILHHPHNSTDKVSKFFSGCAFSAEANVAGTRHGWVGLSVPLPANPELQGDLDTLLRLKLDTHAPSNSSENPSLELASMLQIYYLKKWDKPANKEHKPGWGEQRWIITTVPMAERRAPLSHVLLPVCKELPPCACKSHHQNEMTTMKKKNIYI